MSVAATSPLCTLGTKHRAPADIIDRAPLPPNRVSNETMKVVVFQRRPRKISHLCYTSHVSLQCQTRVKLNRVFFPR